MPVFDSTNAPTGFKGVFTKEVTSVLGIGATLDGAGVPTALTGSTLRYVTVAPTQVDRGGSLAMRSDGTLYATAGGGTWVVIGGTGVGWNLPDNVIGTWGTTSPLQVESVYVSASNRFDLRGVAVSQATAQASVGIQIATGADTITGAIVGNSSGSITAITGATNSSNAGGTGGSTGTVTIATGAALATLGTSGASGSLQIATGSSVSAATGFLSIATGSAAATGGAIVSGLITIGTGAVGGTGTTGAIAILSGSASGAGTSGALVVASGNVATTGISGNTGIATGTTVTGTTGTVSVISGAASGAGTSGGATVGSGNVALAGISGNAIFQTGTTATGTTGGILIGTGQASGVGTSGSISLVPGAVAAGGTRGTVVATGFRTISDSAAAITSARVLTVADSGGVFSVNQTGGYNITLPTPIVGLRYLFVVNVAAAAAVPILVNGGGASSIGTIVNDITSVIPATAATSVNFASGAAVGDYIEVFSISTTLWGVRAVTSAAGGITVT